MTTEKRPVEVRLRDALHSAAREAPLPPDFAASVADTLTERSQARSGILRFALPSAAAVTGVLVMALLAIALLRPQAPAPGAEAGWGPLAVTPSTGGDLALAGGTLRIGDECVVLEKAQNEVTLLVWPADRTSWEAATRSITFVNLDGQRMTMADGDGVTFVGGGDGTEESGVSGEAWRDGMEWIAPPADGCPLESRWSVGDVVIPTDGSTPAPVPVPLDAPWELVRGSVDGALMPMAEDYRITATVTADSIGGSTGCNSYGAALRQRAGSVAIDEIEQTMRGCGGGPGEAERAYLAALRRINQIEMDGDELVLTGPGVVLRYVALPVLDPVLFAGTSWTLESLIDHDEVRAPMAPGSLELRDDGTFEAFTGCRDLVGTWMVSGDVLTTPAVDAHGVCSEELREQDNHVDSVLGAGPARIDGDRLLLMTNGSLGLVYQRVSSN